MLRVFGVCRGGRAVRGVVAVGDVVAVGGVVVMVVVMSDAVAALTVGGAACDLRPDLADVTQVVEDAPQLVVAGFRGLEVVEAGDFVQGRDGAAVVGRDAGARVADQEGEVELPEDGGGDDGRVVGLGGRGVGVGWLGDVLGAVGAVRGLQTVRVRAPVALDGGGVGGGRGRGGEGRAALRADAFLGAEERGGDRGWCAVGRDEVVRYVLDEEAFALLSGKYAARKPKAVV